MTSFLCPQCFQPYSGFDCPFCAARAARARQWVGQATDAATDTATDTATTDTSSSASVSSNVPATYMTSSSAAVLPASWDDWELLYPPLWIPWAAGKILDPSQETDPATRRAQLGGIAQQLNNVRKTCTALPLTDQQNWDTFSKSFIPWFEKDPSVWDPTLDKPQADLIQDQLRGWQIEFAKYCNIAMPTMPKATPTVEALGEDLLQDVGEAISAAKWILIVGAGLFLVSVAIIGVDNTRKLVLKELL
jgi:hypothetical protein